MIDIEFILKLCFFPRIFVSLSICISLYLLYMIYKSLCFRSLTYA